MKRGTLLDLTITDFADRGKGFARIDAPGAPQEKAHAAGGLVVFVPGAVPGDRMRVEVLRAKKRHVEARLVELFEASDLRVTPPCPYADDCGGCKWQHVDYDAQLAMKTRSVASALRRPSAGTGAPALTAPAMPDAEPAIPSPRRFFYRNKMEFSFSSERWLTAREIASGEAFDRDFALGLHAPGSFARVLDLHECHLQSPLSASVVNHVRVLAQAEGWAPYDQRRHTGWLRHLLIRHGEHTGETLVALVVTEWDEDRIARVAAMLRASFPALSAEEIAAASAAAPSTEADRPVGTDGSVGKPAMGDEDPLSRPLPGAGGVTTFVAIVHDGVGPTALDARTETVFGPGVLHDRIGDLSFEIAPNAFFQTNTRGAELLYRLALDAAELRPGDLVYDLYCGAGTISLSIAPHVRHVVGVELVPEAIANARANALRNGIANATFVAGDMLRVFTPAFVAEHGAPDVLVLDPPRAGVHPRVIDEIARLAPSRIVYVSCNPQTQARDLALLDAAAPGAYRVDRIQPVDMFPHTDHVETVVRLTRVSG